MGSLTLLISIITVPHSDVVDDADYTEFMSGSTSWVLAECPYL